MGQFNAASVAKNYYFLDEYRFILIGDGNSTTNESSLLQYLKNNFNFGIVSDATNYNDFWSVLEAPELYYNEQFKPILDSIAVSSQASCDTIYDKYINMIGLASALDRYICFAGDAFSRMVDGAWSFGNGTIYKTVYGKTNEIIKYGLDEAVSDVSKIINSIRDKINSLDEHKYNDTEYLRDIRDNFILPKINEIPSILSKSMVELGKMQTFCEMVAQAIDKDFPDAFKLFSCISLAFSLNSKMSKISNQVLAAGSPSSDINRLGLTVAKIWRKEILPDQTNREQCFTQAVLQGLNSLPVCGNMEALIEKSWELYVTKYGY